MIGSFAQICARITAYDNLNLTHSGGTPSAVLRPTFNLYFWEGGGKSLLKSIENISVFKAMLHAHASA